MATILLVDDALFCRELVSKALRHEGYEVVTASDGREALAALKQNHVHLIVLDNDMPVMDGAAFLRERREIPRWAMLPVIMLTDNSHKDKVVNAKMLGVSEYILKAQFTLEKLLESVKRLLPGSAASIGGTANPTTNATAVPTRQTPIVKTPAPTTQPAAASTATAAPNGDRPKEPAATPPIAPSDMRAKVVAAIEAIDQTRTLGGEVAQVLAIANSPDGNLRDLVQVVRKDPVLSTRLLRLANSAFIASHRPPASTLEDAIKYVGVTGVGALAMSVGVFRTFSMGDSADLGLLRCWEHALATAELMDRLSASSAASVARSDPGIARLVGLCHDLGEILLRQRFPEAFLEAEQKALASNLPVLQVLPDVFGIPYDQIAERLLMRLCLPAAISQPIIDHARREGGRPKSAATPASRMLWQANRYVNGLMLTSSVSAMVAPIPVSEYPDAALIDDTLLRQEVPATLCAMAALPEAMEAAMLQPMFPRMPLNLLYVRDRCYSAFDPLEISLKTLGEVTTVNAYPTKADEFPEHSLMVVATPELNMHDGSKLGDYSPAPGQPPENSLFILSRGLEADQPRRNGREYGAYPLSLQALYNLLQRRCPQPP